MAFVANTPTWRNDEQTRLHCNPVLEIIMKCCAIDQLDCCHLEKHEGYWTCRAHYGETVNSRVEGCPDYETGGEYALRVALHQMLDKIDRDIQESHKWRDCYIRWSVISGIVTLTAYTIFIWSII